MDFTFHIENYLNCKMNIRDFSKIILDSVLLPDNDKEQLFLSEYLGWNALLIVISDIHNILADVLAIIKTLPQDVQETILSHSIITDENYGKNAISLAFSKNVDINAFWCVLENANNEVLKAAFANGQDAFCFIRKLKQEYSHQLLERIMPLYNRSSYEEMIFSFVMHDIEGASAEKELREQLLHYLRVFCSHEPSRVLTIMDCYRYNSEIYFQVFAYIYKAFCAEQEYCQEDTVLLGNKGIYFLNLQDYINTSIKNKSSLFARYDLGLLNTAKALQEILLGKRIFHSINKKALMEGVINPLRDDIFMPMLNLGIIPNPDTIIPEPTEIELTSSPP